MSYIHVFAQHHEPAMLAEIPPLAWVTPVHNRTLRMNPTFLQTDQLADGRVIMSGLEHPDGTVYAGLLNGRAHHKYSYLGFRWETAVRHLVVRLGTWNAVVGLWTTDAGPAPCRDWLEFSEGHHPGISSLTQLICDKAGIKLKPKRRSVWANDFICHRSVWDDWRKHWRAAFWAMHKIWGLNPPLPDWSVDPARKPAYLMERVTTAYFAARNDLEIVQF